MTTPPEHRLLAVFAHPDDETIGAGGLLAMAVAAGVDVSVVTCTRGERGEVIPADLAALAGDPQGLAAHRERELSTALALLGVHRHLFLDQVPGLTSVRPDRFEDSGMEWIRPGIAGPVADAGPRAFTAVDVDIAAVLLAVVIRHVRPTVVLTEEPGGGYGHPDHVHAHRVTMRAIELAATPEPAPIPDHVSDPLVGLAAWQVPTTLWVAQEEGAARAALAELAAYIEHDGAPVGASGNPLTVPPSDGELPGVIAPPGEIEASVDATGVVDRVLQALRAHRSQVQAVEPLPDGEHLAGHLALSNDMLMPVPRTVHLRPAPGSRATALADLLRTVPTTGIGPAVGSGAAETGTRGDTEGFGPPVIGAPGVSAQWAGDPSAIPPAPAGSPAPHAAAAGHPATPGAPHATDPAAPHAAAAADRAVSASGQHAAAARAGAAHAPQPDPATRPTARPDGGWITYAVAAGAGLVMGMLGTVVHRYSIEGWPVGVVIALLGVLAAAVAARALGRGGGLLVAAIAVVVITQAMAFLRPGGDILVTDEVISYVWLFGAPAACVLAAALPRSWFADRRGQPR